MLVPMVVAALPDISEADSGQTWIAQELARLAPEHRAQYDVDAWFRDFVHTALEMEWRDPAGVAMEQKARETYGSDFERARDDFDAGRHPFRHRPDAADFMKVRHRGAARLTSSVSRMRCANGRPGSQLLLDPGDTVWYAPRPSCCPSTTCRTRSISSIFVRPCGALGAGPP
jgi:hypothetical protein